MLLIATTGTIGFYSRAAYQEVYYLCHNFSAGVSKSSVIRQLNTATLSSIAQTKDGMVITFSSNLFWVGSTCVIEFDSQEQVTKARFNY